MRIYFTYVLRCSYAHSEKAQFYTGLTTNLKARLVSHKAKTTRSTKRFDKIEIVYFEGCLNKADARKRELQLKTGFGRGYLKRRIENYLKNAQE